VYFTLDHIFTHLFNSLLTFKAMLFTVFLEFYPLTKFAGNRKFEKCEDVPLLVKGYILHTEHVFCVEIFKVLLHKFGHSKNVAAHANVKCSSAHVKLI